MSCILIDFKSYLTWGGGEALQIYFPPKMAIIHVFLSYAQSGPIQLPPTLC